jgi:hypothetical protein
MKTYIPLAFMRFSTYATQVIVVVHVATNHITPLVNPFTIVFGVMQNFKKGGFNPMLIPPLPLFVCPPLSLSSLIHAFVFLCPSA